jgi:hypothetical protein
VDALQRKGMVMVTGGGRGRYSATKIVAQSIHQPIGIKAGELKARLERKAWARFSEDERAELRRDAERWREGLQRSLEAVGFTSPDEYLAFVCHD